MRELLDWFQVAVTHAGSLEEGVAVRPLLSDAGQVAQLVSAGPSLSALERLRIYHSGYRSRLRECLADDYPGLQHALGEAGFDALADAYVAAHPPTSRTLNAYGRLMEAFCRDSADAPLGEVPAGFAADLAALEWALVDAVHAPEVARLAPGRLAEIPVESWARARLGRCPSARLLRADYPVNDWFQAFREDRAPAIPEKAPSATVAYRNGTTVWRMGLSPAMADVLGALFDGAPLEDALAALPDGDDDVMAQAVMRCFGDWVAGGLFTDVGFEGS